MPRKSDMDVDQIARLRWFHDQVSNGYYPDALALVSHFGISSSLAYKDIEAFKSDYQAPLAFDGKRRGFSYKDASYTPAFRSTVAEAAPPALKKKATSKAAAKKEEKPAPVITGDELVSVLIADMLRRNYRTAPFSDAVQSAFNKIADSLDETTTYDRHSLERILELDMQPFPSLDLSIFDALSKAIKSRETVVLNYFSGQKATVTDKQCDPLHIINYRDNWYLVAFCHEKQDYRDFLMNRILSIEFTDKVYEPYKAFHIEKHKAESQLLSGMEAPTEVHIEFDKYAAHWIRLRAVHPTQKIVERADGSLELTFKVYSYENLLRWLLSFGEHARVLRPQELQERMRRTILRMGHLYGR
jgi:predicted DNA-binding transcriptional regulator YafY